MKKLVLDKEEQDILDSFERGEWRMVKNPKTQAGLRRAAAREMPREEQRVVIRISSKDLAQLQTIAGEDGVPCRTLMANVLHRFASGRPVKRVVRSHRPI